MTLARIKVYKTFLDPPCPGGKGHADEAVGKAECVECVMEFAAKIWLAGFAAGRSNNLGPKSKPQNPYAEGGE